MLDLPMYLKCCGRTKTMSSSSPLGHAQRMEISQRVMSMPLFGNQLVDYFRTPIQCAAQSTSTAQLVLSSRFLSALYVLVTETNVLDDAAANSLYRALCHLCDVTKMMMVGSTASPSFLQSYAHTLFEYRDKMFVVPSSNRGRDDPFWACLEREAEQAWQQVAQSQTSSSSSDAAVVGPEVVIASYVLPSDNTYEVKVTSSGRQSSEGRHLDVPASLLQSVLDDDLAAAAIVVYYAVRFVLDESEDADAAPFVFTGLYCVNGMEEWPDAISPLPRSIKGITALSINIGDGLQGKAVGRVDCVANLRSQPAARASVCPAPLAYCVLPDDGAAARIPVVLFSWKATNDLLHLLFECVQCGECGLTFSVGESTLECGGDELCVLQTHTVTTSSRSLPPGTLYVVHGRTVHMTPLQPPHHKSSRGGAAPRNLDTTITGVPVGVLSPVAAAFPSSSSISSASLGDILTPHLSVQLVPAGIVLQSEEQQGGDGDDDDDVWFRIVLLPGSSRVGPIMEIAEAALCLQYSVVKRERDSSIAVVVHLPVPLAGSAPVDGPGMPSPHAVAGSSATARLYYDELSREFHVGDGCGDGPLEVVGVVAAGSALSSMRGSDLMSGRLKINVL
eukprot:PhM_4_TR14763/c0_g1_i1/m.18538